MHDVMSDWSDLARGTQSLFILAAGVAAAILTSLFFRNVVPRITRATRTDLDDELARVLATPLALTCVIAGAWAAFVNLRLADPWPYAWRGLLLSAGVIVWSTVLDAMNTRIYKALGQAGIEIPYPKRDVYLHAAEPVPVAITKETRE